MKTKTQTPKTPQPAFIILQSDIDAMRALLDQEQPDPYNLRLAFNEMLRGAPKTER